MNSIFFFLFAFFLCFCCSVTNRPIDGTTRDIVTISAMLRQQMHHSVSITNQDPDNCPFSSYMHISGHSFYIILLIPDQGHRWCWSVSQRSLGMSLKYTLDRPAVHPCQSLVQLMFMDCRKNPKEKTHRDMGGDMLTPHKIAGTFAASSFGKIHHLF